MNRQEILDRIKRAFGVTLDAKDSLTYTERYDSIKAGIETFLNSNLREEAISLINEVNELVKSDSIDSIVLYIALSTYGEIFGANPELMVVLSEWAPSTGDEERATNLLESLWSGYRDNYYVLWFWVRLSEPWVPREVWLSDDLLLHELRVLDMILALWPEDKLAKRLMKRLKSTGASLHTSTNKEFRYDFPFPDPLQDLTIEELLRPAVQSEMDKIP